MRETVGSEQRSGDLTVAGDLSAANAEFADLVLSGGVFLGGTAAANELDDYEEGTWTPEVADASTSGNTASVSASGLYTKVGKLVTVTCELNNIDTTGMTSGNMLFIRGLPFIADSALFVGAVRTQRLTWASDSNYVFLVIASQSYGLLTSMDNGVGQSSNALVSDIQSAGADIYFTCTYETS